MPYTTENLAAPKISESSMLAPAAKTQAATTPKDPLPEMKSEKANPDATADALPVAKDEAEAGDKSEAGGGGEANVTISEVDSPTTPEAMTAKRIPPRVATDVSVTVSGMKKKSKPVSFKISNQNSSNGKASFNGLESYTVAANGTYTLSLKGEKQTSTGGNGGNLKLVATQADKENVEKEKAVSNGFSVSAIPQNWHSKKMDVTILGNERGFYVEEFVESDSEPGTGAKSDDLNAIRVWEHVNITSKSGFFEDWTNESITKQKKEKKLWGSDGFMDRHVYTIYDIRPGKIEIDQTHSFVDNRSGSNEVAVKNSGYKRVNEILERTSDMIKNDDEKFAGFPYSTFSSKAGGKASADGFDSDPGATEGTIEQKFYALQK